MMKTAAVTDLAALAIEDVYLRLLDVAPWNARKTFDSAALKELTESIGQRGIQVPLLVRSLKKGDRLEIVAGHRRFKAAELLGLKTVPCIVRELSDSQAREVAMVDNLQREDLPPLEEAQGFREMLTGSEVEAIAAKLGKSGSYVTRRLKLLDAIKPVQNALKVGAIEVGHALELARLSDDQQKNILKEMEIGWHGDESDRDDDDFDGEMGLCKFCGCDELHACALADGKPCSWTDQEETVCSNPDCIKKAQSGEVVFRPTTWTVADLKSHIRRNSCRNLSSAPFPLNDAGLGEIACTGCPKRTMNTALLFNDFAGSDTCTDSVCFERKSAEFIKIEVKLAAKNKRPLLQISDGYTGEKGVLRSYEVTVIGEGGSKPCDHEEEAIWVNGRNLGKTVQVCRKKECKVHGSSSSSGRSGSKLSPDVEAARKKVVEKVKAKKAYRAALMKALATAPVPPARVNDLNLEVCLQLIHHANSQQVGKVATALGWPETLFNWNSKKALREKLASLTPLERLRIALLAEHCGEMSVQEYSLDAKPEDLERLAKLLDVDTKKLDAPVVTAKPAPAKAAEEAAAVGGGEEAYCRRTTEARWAASKPAKRAAKKKAGRK